MSSLTSLLGLLFFHLFLTPTFFGFLFFKLFTTTRHPSRPIQLLTIVIASVSQDGRLLRFFLPIPRRRWSAIVILIGCAFRIAIPYDNAIIAASGSFHMIAPALITAMSPCASSTAFPWRSSRMIVGTPSSATMMMVVIMIIIISLSRRRRRRGRFTDGLFRFGRYVDNLLHLLSGDDNRIPFIFRRGRIVSPSTGHC